MKICDIFRIFIFYFAILVYSKSEVPSSSDEYSSCEFEDAITLDLSDNGIKRIKASFAKSSTINCINLQNNNISYIHDEAFDDLPKLVYVNLAENRIRQYQFNFVNSKTLETLILDNALVGLEENSLNEYMPQLYQMSSDTEQTSGLILSSTSTTNLPNLKKLYLRRNKINLLKADINWNLTNTMPNLTHLYLNDNEISSMNFLDTLPATLSHLYLSNNKISQFTTTWLHNLKVLIMDNNELYSLCGYREYYGYCNGVSLKGAVKLQNFSIVNVGLEKIEPDAFEDQINLQYLDMSNNNITNLVQHTFDNLIHLIMFRLNNNELTFVPDLCKLRKLEFFSFAHNSIEEIDEFTFCGLSNLKTLILTNNRLKFIHPKSFHNLKSLIELNLSANNIVTMPENWCSKDCIVQQLNLARNLFNNIASLSLTNTTTTLAYLDISGNSFKQIIVKNLLSLPVDTIIDLYY